MKPVNFPERNMTLHKPENMTDEECQPLEIYTDGKKCISKWKLSFKERIQVLFKGHVWLWIFSGHTQPPVSLEIDYPFIKE